LFSQRVHWEGYCSSADADAKNMQAAPLAPSVAQLLAHQLLAEIMEQRVRSLAALPDT
jgi:hypothetical protein